MKVLIIGASGFLGGTIYYKLKMAGADVLGTYNNHRKLNDFVKLDVMNSQELVRIIGEYLPDVVVWTVMNHNAEEEVADDIMPVLCDTIGDTRIIFVSTSVAYEKNMSEDVTPFLRTEEMYNHHYFNGKIKSESVIRKLPNYCIVRSGSIYGINPYGEMDERSCKLKEYVDSGEKYIRASNIVFSIVEVNELADAIIELITSDYIGIMNVSEEEPISHYDFNKALCKRYGWDDSCIVANEEEESIYYFDNSLRKCLLNTRITRIGECVSYEMDELIHPSAR